MFESTEELPSVDDYRKKLAGKHCPNCNTPFTEDSMGFTGCEPNADFKFAVVERPKGYLFYGYCTDCQTTTTLLELGIGSMVQGETKIH